MNEKFFLRYKYRIPLLHEGIFLLCGNAISRRFNLMYNNASLSFIVYGGIFMALTILFTYVFAIQTTFIRVDFAFIPICLYAMRFWHDKKLLLCQLLQILSVAIFFMPGFIFFLDFTISAIASSFYFMANFLL